MNQTIWYCTKNMRIFPNKDEAMREYKKWLEENNCIDFFNEDFPMLYKEITFTEYNELID